MVLGDCFMSVLSLLPRPLSVFHLSQSILGHVVQTWKKKREKKFTLVMSTKRIDREGLGESHTWSSHGLGQSRGLHHPLTKKPGLSVRDWV